MRLRNTAFIVASSILGLVVASCGDDSSSGTKDAAVDSTAGSDSSAAVDASARDAATGADVQATQDAAVGEDGATWQDGSAVWDGSPAADGQAGGCRDNSDCRSSEYCQKSSCQSPTGRCVPRPRSCPDNYGPVCGCDGLTYWNGCLAEQLGANVQATGVCDPRVAALCGGVGGLSCPTRRASCALLFQDRSGCQISDPSGTCWILPQPCPAVTVGTEWRPCQLGDLRCVSMCEAIESGRGYWHDRTCPQ